MAFVRGIKTTPIKMWYTNPPSTIRHFRLKYCIFPLDCYIALLLPSSNHCFLTTAWCQTTEWPVKLQHRTRTTHQALCSIMSTKVCEWIVNSYTMTVSMSILFSLVACSLRLNSFSFVYTTDPNEKDSEAETTLDLTIQVYVYVFVCLGLLCSGSPEFILVATIVYVI